MTCLIISTCIREAPPATPSGHLYILDLENLEILQKTAGIEPPYRDLDSNPRGGTRGIRGLSFHGEEIAVAIFSVIFFFDCQWNLVRTITHPSVSNIHEILYTRDGVWVTSTVNDLLVKLCLDGKISEFDNMRSRRSLMFQVRGPLQQKFSDEVIQAGRIDFRKQSNSRLDDFDRTHLNGVEMLPDGRIMLSLGLIVGDLFAGLHTVKEWMMARGIWKWFISINRFIRGMFGLKKKMLSELLAQPLLGRSAILIGDPKDGWQTRLQLRVAQNPSHSPRLLEDGTGLYLDSSNGRLVHFDDNGNILSNAVISDKFLRGLLILPNGQLAIGAGNTLLVYDLTQGEVVRELQLTEDVNVSIFDIKILPEIFGLPPGSLEIKFGQIVGFEGSKIIWDRDS